MLKCSEEVEALHNQAGAFVASGMVNTIKYTIFLNRISRRFLSGSGAVFHRYTEHICLQVYCIFANIKLSLSIDVFPKLSRK